MEDDLPTNLHYLSRNETVNMPINNTDEGSANREKYIQNEIISDS